MGATTNDIYGGSGGAEPALPGTYGRPPKGYRLPDATRLGRVVLQVGDLARSVAFYEQVLGFRTMRQDAGVAMLTPQGSDRVLVELREKRGVTPAHRRLGLYHFAILLPDRPSLGRFVQHLADVGLRAGAADHLVSEAFYLSDPDGLGIEVYADRPRETWKRIERQLMMASDPIDVNSLVAAAGNTSWTGMPAGTVIGHVHLHVGDIAKGDAFYGGGVGFDQMAWSYPGALFFGAGGYHHHLGTNIWAGTGAQPARADEARLEEWTIEVPSLADVDAAAVSIAAAGFTVTRDDDDAVAGDPWGTKVRLHALGA